MSQTLAGVDLFLTIERRPDGGYRTVVPEGPAAGESPFEPPFSEAQARHLLKTLDLPALAQPMAAAADREVRTVRRATTSEHLEAGRQLFTALFRDKARDAYHQALAEKRTGRADFVRLHLSFGLGEAWPGYVASLPWDLLCPPDNRDYLAMGEEVRLVRELRVARAWAPYVLRRPFRVLVVEAQVVDQDSLALQNEWSALLRELDGSEQVSLERFEGRSIEDLRERLEQGRFNGLHFMGHGEFDSGEGAGYLVFSRDGYGERVSGHHLATNLRDLPELQLAVLNACHSGVLTEGHDEDPFLGVGAALLGTGSCAVVAMQSRISDPAAIAFASGFYRELGKGRGIERALYAGRLRILNRLGAGSFAWAIPALYTPHRALLGGERRASLPDIDTDEEVGNRRADRRSPRAALVVLLLFAILVAVLWLRGQLGPAKGFERDSPLIDLVNKDQSLDDRSPLDEGAGDIAEASRGEEAETSRSAGGAVEPREASATPKVITSPITPGVLGIAFLDEDSGEMSREVNRAARSVLATQAPGTFARILDLPTDTLERWVDGHLDLSSQPDRAPGGAQWLLIGISAVRSISGAGSPLPRVSVTATASLIDSSTQAIQLNVQETQTGMGVDQTSALIQAVERCLADVIEHLKEGSS